MPSSTTKIQYTLKDKPFEPNTMMKIVNLLNSAEIPSILWGNSMLDIYGVPTIDLVCLLFVLEILLGVLMI